MIDNLFIAGTTGSGKSHHFKEHILPVAIKEKEFQIIILDMKNEYHCGLTVPLHSIKRPMDLANIEVGNYTKGRAPRLLVLKADWYTPNEIEGIFEYLCKARRKLLVFEEASFYFEDLKTGKLPDWTKRFFRQTLLPHNNDNRCILITQSPTDIPKIVLGQLQKGIIFELKPFQLKYLYEKEFLPNPPDAYPFEKPYQYYEID